MSASSNALPESAAVGAPGYKIAVRRPFYWSVRRELWENRFIYIAPLIVAAVELFGFLVSSIGLPLESDARSGTSPSKNALRRIATTILPSSTMTRSTSPRMTLARSRCELPSVAAKRAARPSNRRI